MLNYVLRFRTLLRENLAHLMLKYRFLLILIYPNTSNINFNMREIGNKTGPDTLILKYHCDSLKTQFLYLDLLKKRQKMLSRIFFLSTENC